MLQSIQAQIGELGGFRVAEDASDTAVIMEPIVVAIVHRCFDACSPRTACSIAPLQISRSEAEWSRTTVAPLRESWNCPRVTRPITNAVILYCAEMVSKRASDACDKDTTARAPVSEKSASSAGSALGHAASAVNPFEAKPHSASATAMPPSLTSCAEASIPSPARATSALIRRNSAARSIAGG